MQIFKNKWLLAFLISHILGWISTHLHTIWLTKEIRKNRKSGES